MILLMLLLAALVFTGRFFPVGNGKLGGFLLRNRIAIFLFKSDRDFRAEIDLRFSF